MYKVLYIEHEQSPVLSDSSKMEGQQMAEKTATQIIEEVRDEMCNKYCKYPDLWNDENGELCDSEECQNCPLNKL